MSSVLGLGLAALGRPGYLNVGHGRDIGASHSIEAMEQRCHEVCDAAWECGIRWFDAARSYGLAEQFLAGWLRERGIGPADVTVSSKWGYTYTANWQVDADPPEVKDHGLGALQRQWPETQALLGPWLRLYQVHSATLDSGILEHPDVHRALTGLGCPVGISLSGPRQAETLRRALRLTVDDRSVFSSVQATWNLLEPSVGPALAEAKAAGWTVIVKEALANGRLAAAGPPPGRSAPGPTSSPSPPHSLSRGSTSCSVARRRSVRFGPTPTPWTCLWPTWISTTWPGWRSTPSPTGTSELPCRGPESARPAVTARPASPRRSRADLAHPRRLPR